MIEPKTLKTYFDTRSNPHEGYIEQVLGAKKLKELAQVWKKHGKDLEYLREVLEYQYILDYYPSKEQAKLISDVFSRQNKFLLDCYERIILKREAIKAQEKTFNSM